MAGEKAVTYSITHAVRFNALKELVKAYGYKPLTW